MFEQEKVKQLVGIHKFCQKNKLKSALYLFMQQQFIEAIKHRLTHLELDCSCCVGKNMYRVKRKG